MWLNKKIIVILLSLVGVSFIFNLGLYSKINVDRILASKIKGELYNSSTGITINYLSPILNNQVDPYFGNLYDDSGIVRAYLKEPDIYLEEMALYDLFENRNYKIKRSNYYSNVEEFLEKLREKEFIIKDIVAYRGSGFEDRVDIGELHLKYNEEKFNRGELLEEKSWESSDEISTVQNYKVKKDCYIKSINSAYIEELLKVGNLYINSKDIKDVKFPMHYSEGDMVNIKFVFNEDEEERDAFNGILTDVVIELEGEDTSRETVYFRVNTLGNNIGYENIIKAKEESNEDL